MVFTILIVSKISFKFFLHCIYLLVFRFGDRVPLHCVDRHPNQQHIVATGGQDGMLCVWDVRQGNTPFSLMEAHSAESKILRLYSFCVFYKSLY